MSEVVFMIMFFILGLCLGLSASLPEDNIKGQTHEECNLVKPSGTECVLGYDYVEVKL